MSDKFKALKKHRRLYVATPYTKYRLGIQQAWKDAATATAELFKAGLDAYSPIVHHHPIAVVGDLDPLDHKIWLPANKSQIEDADAIVVVLLEGWDESYGVRVEIEMFQNAGKSIYYLHPVTLEVTEVKIPLPIRHPVQLAEGYNGA